MDVCGIGSVEAGLAARAASSHGSQSFKVRTHGTSFFTDPRRRLW
jgi:hypothetical protein